MVNLRTVFACFVTRRSHAMACLTPTLDLECRIQRMSVPIGSVRSRCILLYHQTALIRARFCHRFGSEDHDIASNVLTRPRHRFLRDQRLCGKLLGYNYPSHRPPMSGNLRRFSLSLWILCETHQSSLLSSINRAIGHHGREQWVLEAQKCAVDDCR